MTNGRFNQNSIDQNSSTDFLFFPLPFGAGGEAGFVSLGTNRSSEAFLGEIPMMDYDQVAKKRESALAAGFAAVLAAVSDTAHKGKNRAVSLLAEAPKEAASAEAVTPEQFILAEGMSIHEKVAARIVSKQFVDMAELRTENLTPVVTLKEANPLSQLISGTRRKLSPGPGLTSLASYFAAYTIISCSRHRDDATMLLGYLRLVFAEGVRFSRGKMA